MVLICQSMAAGAGAAAVIVNADPDGDDDDRGFSASQTNLFKLVRVPATH